ncbi:aconitate hydratase [Maribellus comscasis]|uniref:Aconitate hydratase n=1 Tax=Maribellus comscasis TaxID=2681766 RepID=A0A6I6JZ35_9BACT|nr:aconitate hydratase [Maribellus comscasis]QGY42944.1 aconitate hydratase [Maribellus comscasis]
MKKLNVAQKLIQSHLLSGEMVPGEEIGLKIDHILQQDATGTLIMLELEKIGIKRVSAEVAVQYVDHNLLQTDFKNADDHLFLQSAAKKFGYWFSRPGNGISHVVHMERFGKPGKSMIGSDSHTCSAGSMGMLAIGAGGLDVATAAAGEPFYITMPKIFGVELTGELPDWVSAKDIVLEMLRRYDVKGGVGYIIEYFGEGVKTLSAWDRHVIANMGAELGATTSVFPSDDMTWVMLKQEDRGNDWQGITADEGAEYDKTDHIHLPDLVPLIAKPSSPGKVVPVYEVDGEPISQVVVGSSANPGLRDFWMVSEIVKGKDIPPEVSLDINPSSRQKIEDLSKMGAINVLMQAGARFHQTGCMGCIGMGQAPASNTISLRTMPRNFPGRSGTADDQVFLCSPETAAVSALFGKITNPKKYGKYMKYPKYEEPENASKNTFMLVPPAQKNESTELKKGPNIKSLPDFEAVEDSFKVPVALKMEDNISTDEILKAGAEVLPLRSNIEAISKYAYYVIDQGFFDKALKMKESDGGHVVVAGENYAQGSSREHAAIAPRYLGQKAVIAKSYARIGFQNLVNYGIVPFVFENPEDYDKINPGDILEFQFVWEAIRESKPALVVNKISGAEFPVVCKLTPQQKNLLLAGGLINFLRKRKK